MRLPFGHGIRGLNRRGCLFALLLMCFGVGTANAQAPTLALRDTGHINFVSTGGSLRTQDNNGNSCAVGSTSTQALSGVPLNPTSLRAFLYWGGSGGTADTSVTLNGTPVTASNTFAATYNGVTPSLPFFGAFREITDLGIVNGNGNYTFGGLSVVTGSPHCDVSAVVSGWSLIVVYELPSERLRAINLYHGLAPFRGGQHIQTPTGFRIPNSNIDGRVAVFTLEGDPANSTTQDGFDEALRFNGNLLNDGINVAGSDPLVQQYDGTINTQGVATSYGIDVDQYDVSAFLTPGQTSATLTYSAGADLVLLMTQIVSATSDPIVDLSVTSTHSGTFVAGGTGQYTITVSNSGGAGIEREDNTVTVRDTLPAGLTYNSFTGTGWTCGAVGQLVTCTHPPTLNPGASFPPLTLTVNVLEAAAASVVNTVVVSTTSYELITPNNTATDTTATLDPNLSTSTKTFVDLNGGEAAPGDTLRYTVTLTESAGGQAVNVTLTDNIPDNTSFASFFSIPAGATSAYAPPPAGPPVNNGLITVSGITVPASSSVTVVFDVTVIAGTAPGETVNNTATINNPNGPENNPAAPQIIVTPSLIPASGTKFLYLRRNSAGTKNLSRIRPSAATDVNESVAGAGNDAFVITPALRAPLTIPTGNIPVRLWLSRNGGTGARDITVTLSSTPGGNIATQTVSVNPNNSTTTPTMVSFTLSNGAVRNLAAGTTLTLTVANGASNAASNAFFVWPNGNGGSTAGVPHNSRIELNTTTVINVDSVLTYNAAYNGGAVQATFYPGASVFVRAQISDPFGAFDITNARITITDPANVEHVTNALMTPQAASGCGLTTGATCIFQTPFAVPASPALGLWRVRVTGLEGVEDTVSDFNLGEFTVVIPQPSLTILKSSRVLSDPVNNTTLPKRIPLAVVQYDVTVTNSGPGIVDSGTLVITDAIPVDASMYVSTSAGDPVVFANGTPVSGLNYIYATHVSYSSVGVGGPWTYVPVADPSGFDAAVRAVRISPAGAMSAASGGNPAFTIHFRVRIR
jgi:trimeric autotransporter adhesin